MTTEDLKGNLEKIYSESVSTTLTKEADTWIHIEFLETGIGRKARVSFDEYGFIFNVMPPLKKEDFITKTVRTLHDLRQEKEWLLDLGFDYVNNHYYKLTFDFGRTPIIFVLKRDYTSITIYLMKRDGTKTADYFVTTCFKEALQEFLSRNSFRSFFRSFTGTEEGWIYLPSKLRDLTING